MVLGLYSYKLTEIFELILAIYFSDRRSSREVSTRSRARSTSGGGDDDDDGRHPNDSSFEEGIRRSTRQRKLVYDTYDQKLIDRHMAIIADDESLYRTRRTQRSSDHMQHKMPQVTRKRKHELAVLAENGPNVSLSSKGMPLCAQ